MSRNKQGKTLSQQKLQKWLKNTYGLKHLPCSWVGRIILQKYLYFQKKCIELLQSKLNLQ